MAEKHTQLNSHEPFPPEKRKRLLIMGGGSVLLFLLGCYLFGGGDHSGSRDDDSGSFHLVQIDSDSVHYEVPFDIEQVPPEDLTQMPKMEVGDVWGTFQPHPDTISPPTPAETAETATAETVPENIPAPNRTNPVPSGGPAMPLVAAVDEKKMESLRPDPSPRVPESSREANSPKLAETRPPVGEDKRERETPSPSKPLLVAAADTAEHTRASITPKGSPHHEAAIPSGPSAGTVMESPPEVAEEPRRAQIVEDDSDDEIVDGRVPKAIQLDIVVPRLAREGVVGHSRGLITAEMFSLALGDQVIDSVPPKTAPGAPAQAAALVRVSRPQALAFAAWLTRGHRAAGLIASDQSYRLPTREEASSPQIWHQDEPPFAAEDTRPFGVVLVERSAQPSDATLPAAIPVLPAAVTPEGIPLRTDIPEGTSPLKKVGPDKPLWKSPEPAASQD